MTSPQAIATIQAALGSNALYLRELASKIKRPENCIRKDLAVMRSKGLVQKVTAISEGNKGRRRSVAWRNVDAGNR